MEVLSKTTETTKELACRIALDLKENTVLALHGDLGSGKTTFTRYLVDALGINARVQSPTFILHRQYSSEDKTKLINTVHHLDLYRLTQPSELEELDFVELFNNPNSIVIIEWPDIAHNVLPQNTMHIYFEYINENTRKITYDENTN